MRHKYKGRKLGTDYGHTKAMKTGLVQALFLNDRIKTTETRAKEIRGDVDRVITWAKRGDLHSRRLAIAALGNDSELAREIFEKVEQGMFKDRPGGYTRILKLGPRKGDGARMVIIELVTENCIPKAQKQAAASAKAQKKATSTKKDTSKADEEEKPSVEDENLTSKDVVEEGQTSSDAVDAEEASAETSDQNSDDAEEIEANSEKDSSSDADTESADEGATSEDEPAESLADEAEEDGSEPDSDTEKE